MKLYRLASPVQTSSPNPSGGIILNRQIQQQPPNVAIAATQLRPQQPTAAVAATQLRTVATAPPQIRMQQNEVSSEAVIVR